MFRRIFIKNRIIRIRLILRRTYLFELSESGYVTLKVYDITGREVKELINGKWEKQAMLRIQC